MKKSQVKSFIKEIIREYLNESSQYRFIQGAGWVKGPESVGRQRPQHIPLTLSAETPKLGNLVEVSTDLIKTKYYSPDNKKKVKIKAGSIGVIRDIRGKFNWTTSRRHYMTFDPKLKKYVPRTVPEDRLRYLVRFDKYGYVSMERNEFRVIKK